MRILAGVAATRSAAEPARRLVGFGQAERALTVAAADDGSLVIASDIAEATVQVAAGDGDTLTFSEVLADGTIGEVVLLSPAISTVAASEETQPTDTTEV